jgi:hypothetical protein
VRPWEPQWDVQRRWLLLGSLIQDSLLFRLICRCSPLYCVLPRRFYTAFGLDAVFHSLSKRPSARRNFQPSGGDGGGDYIACGVWRGRGSAAAASGGGRPAGFRWTAAAWAPSMPRGRRACRPASERLFSAWAVPLSHGAAHGEWCRPPAPPIETTERCLRRPAPRCREGGHAIGKLGGGCLQPIQRAAHPRHRPPRSDPWPARPINSVSTRRRRPRARSSQPGPPRQLSITACSRRMCGSGPPQYPRQYRARWPCAPAGWRGCDTVNDALHGATVLQQRPANSSPGNGLPAASCRACRACCSISWADSGSGAP